jgi:hypothetical protein
MNPLKPYLTELPSMIALADSPQLASLALLQTTLRVVSTSLDLYHPDLGSVLDVARDSSGWQPCLLAQLIFDRCRELADLIAAYRIALHPPPSDSFHDDDLPF